MSALLRDYLNFVKEQSPIRPEKQAEAEGGPAKPACNRFPKQGFPRSWKEDSKEEAAKMEVAKKRPHPGHALLPGSRETGS